MTERPIARKCPPGWNPNWYWRAYGLATEMSRIFNWASEGPKFLRIVDFLFRSKHHAAISGLGGSAKIPSLATPETAEEIGDVLQTFDIAFGWDKPEQSQEHEQFLFAQMAALRMKELREGLGKKLAR